MCDELSPTLLEPGEVEIRSKNPLMKTSLLYLGIVRKFGIRGEVVEGIALMCDKSSPTLLEPQ